MSTRPLRHLLIAAACAGIGLAQAQPAATPFDGRWQVTLTCDDLKTANSLVKGYTFVFPAQIAGGQLTGQRGDPGQASSITMSGTVDTDGAAAINVDGRTGKPEYVVGRLQPSSPYSYHMKGSFTPTEGKASRLEVRPCTAVFVRP